MEISRNKCPKCGHEVSSEAKYCSECGCEIVSEGLNNNQSHAGQDVQEELNSRYNKVLSDLADQNFKSAFAGVDSLIHEYPNSHSFAELKEEVVKAFVKSCVEDSDVCLKDGNHKQAKAIANLGLQYDPTNPYLLNVVRKVRRRKAIKRNIFLVVLLVMVLGAVSVYFAFSTPTYNTHNEEEAWSLVAKYKDGFDARKLEEALDAYITAYPSGLHSQEAKNMYDNLVREVEAWNKAIERNDAHAMREFVSAFGNGFFRQQAYIKLDSLSFVEAKNEGTKDAVDYYISNFPDGKYLQQASNLSAKLEQESISEVDREEIAVLIENHFQALTDNNVELFLSTLAPVVNSYLGQTDLTSEDMVDYLSRRYEEMDGDGGFYTFRNMEIHKFDEPGAPLIYNVQFDVSYIIITMEGDEIRKEYAATVTLNSKKRILSLLMKYKDTVSVDASAIVED